VQGRGGVDSDTSWISSLSIWVAGGVISGTGNHREEQVKEAADNLILNTLRPQCQYPDGDDK
jgi:hypothetical protein